MLILRNRLKYAPCSLRDNIGLLGYMHPPPLFSHAIMHTPVLHFQHQTQAQHSVCRYALNGREVTSILMQRFVRVDGKVRTDTTYPAGLMDVIDIAQTDEHFRLVYDAKGRFETHRITKVRLAAQRPCSWLDLHGQLHVRCSRTY